MRNLVLGYVVTDPPVLFHSSHMQSLDNGEQLGLKLSVERWCVGYTSPDGDMFSCPNKTQAEKGAQCVECADNEHMEKCKMCTGRMCANPVRRSSCVFTPHFVYLAAYDDETFKVGVTRAERFHTRILEQGALGAIAIAAAGGQEVRRIEHLINKAGWADRVKLLPMFASEPMSRESCERTLREELIRVKAQVKGVEYMDLGPFVWCGDHYPAQLSQAPRLLHPGADPVAGKVVGVRGGHLLLEVPRLEDEQDPEVVACQLRSLVGREVLSMEEDAVGPAQGAFLF